MEGLCLWMSKTIRSLMDELFVQNRARHSDLIHHALSYLQSNYAKKISLEDAAASVHVSPSYLSRVFKRELRNKHLSASRGRRDYVQS